MAVIDHIKDIYENSAYLSADYVISKYILSHLNEISEMKLTDIAEGTFISKGTVSKYMKKLTKDGSYENFRYAIEMQKNTSLPDINEIQKSAAEYLRNSGLKKAISAKDIERLSLALLKAETIIMIVNRGNRVCLSPLARVLRQENKNVRFMGSYYKLDKESELRSLKDNDVIMLINPLSDAYEESIAGSFESDLCEYIGELNAQVFFVGRSSKDVNKINSIAIRIEQNEFLQRECMEIFSAQLVNKYIQISKNKD